MADGNTLPNPLDLLLRDIWRIDVETAIRQANDLARARYMIARLIIINAASWLVVQLGIAWAVTRLKPERFMGGCSLFNVSEREIGFYRRVLRIRSWKRLLPDGAPWVGGAFPKKRIQSSDVGYLRQFITETKRGETAHWLMLASCPVLCVWNPPWAWVVMAAYACAANFPCIAVQRYNRELLRRRVVRKTSDTHKENACLPISSAL